jgi:sulfate permease, SulP family
MSRTSVLSSSQVSCHPSQDAALEWCEGQILANDRSERAVTAVDDEAALERAFGGEVGPLLPFLERQEIPAGATLVAVGDSADVLYVVVSGRVSALLEIGSAAPVRLETMEGGALVGEIGFYTRSPRGATVVADAPTVAYALRRERLDDLARSEPRLAAQLHRFVAQHLAERSAHLMRVVAALQR